MIFALLLCCLPPIDGPIVVRVPLNAEGQADLRDVVDRLATAARIDVERPAAGVSLPLRGGPAALSHKLLADTLGSDLTIEIVGDQARLRLTGREGQDGRLAAGLKTLVEHGRQEIARRARFGMRGLASYRPNDDNRPTICLVHGINSTSGSFVHMIPLLERAGFGLVAYDFAYNRGLAQTSAEFARDWRAFRRDNADRRPWTIVTHSMGAMLARSYVEGDDYTADVDHLFLIGPVNGGSRLAQAQTALQWVEGVQALNRKSSQLLGRLGDGLGEAADDLLPGSRFLTELNRKPRRTGVAYHILAGDAGFLTRAGRTQIDARIAAVGKANPLLGGLTRITLGDLPARLDELTDGQGDGCLTVAATRLDGVADHEVIPANHVELIRGPSLYPDPGPVACLPFILSRLGRTEP